jgi:hypothetical protein
VRGAFALTSSARASWEEKKLERRLKEAEKLAAKGKFDESALVEVEKRIDKHVDDHDAWKEKEDKEIRKANEMLSVPAAPKKTLGNGKDSVEQKIEEHRAILNDIKSEKIEGERERIEKLEKKLEDKAHERKEKAEKKHSLDERAGNGKSNGTNGF